MNTSSHIIFTVETYTYISWERKKERRKRPEVLHTFSHSDANDDEQESITTPTPPALFFSLILLFSIHIHTNTKRERKKERNRKSKKERRTWTIWRVRIARERTLVYATSKVNPFFFNSFDVILKYFQIILNVKIRTNEEEREKDEIYEERNEWVWVYSLVLHSWPLLVPLLIKSHLHICQYLFPSKSNKNKKQKER